MPDAPWWVPETVTPTDETVTAAKIAAGALTAADAAADLATQAELDAATASAARLDQANTFAQRQTVPDLEIDGALDHDGATVGFFAAVPVAQQAAVTVVNNSAVDNIYAQAEADVLINCRTRINELVARLQAYGLLP